MPLERTIVAGIMKRAREMGWMPIKIHGSQYQLPGLPDVLCLKNGLAVWLEAKVPGNKPSPIQIRRMGELRRYGCRCHVVFSAADAGRCLEQANE